MRMPRPRRSAPVVVDTTPQFKSVSLQELNDRYSVIDFGPDNSYIIANDELPGRELAEPRLDYRELGVAGTKSWLSLAGEDYNPNLRGQLGIQKWDEIRKQDGQVAMALSVRKTPVLGARWYIEPASPSKRDKAIAEYIWNNLTKWSTVSWPLLLREALLHLDFGWYSFEKVFEKVDGKVRWKKFASRHPIDCIGWEWDRNGGPLAARFPAAADEPSKYPTYRWAGGQPVYDGHSVREVSIPIEKLLVFTHAKEGGDIRGISALRPIYKHHYIKDILYKIDSIQKERHGVGVPVIKLPANWNDDDKRLADEMGRNLRANERAHIVLPPNWEIMMLKLEGQPVDVIASANHHNQMIANTMLCGFMDSGGNVSVEALLDLFMKATRIDADVVRDVFNKWAIPELVRWNWGKTAADNSPELRVRRIGEMADWRTLTFALRNLTGSNLLIPDKPLREQMRSEFDLPAPDPATADPLPSTPQSPNLQPRQSRASGMQSGSGKGNSGDDRSGTSGER